ncbi:hypothetical protein GY45DRAFT_1332149 [Cubamyces sp. BRFM 1775]|nr:hypothetical protein GY45DRAFT_1332149 [Cubamyces sp. BRFM 1775]
MSSPGLAVDGLAARRKALVEQQTALARELLSTNRALNALQPANQLPVELLTKIFHLLQMHDGEYNESWYSVAAVCTYWHGVANECMSLWRRIDLGSSVKLIDVFLAPPGVPVVGARRALPDFANFSNDLNQMTNRIMGIKDDLACPLRATCCYGSDSPHHLGRLSTLITVLVLDGRRPQWCYEPDEVAVGHFKNRFTAALEVPLDPAMFARLHSLTLITVAPSPHAAPFSTLRTLHLYDCISMSTSMSTFLTFISGCQALEELSIRMFRPKDDHLPAFIHEEAPAPKQMSPLASVTLPETLRRFGIQDIAPWTARILEGMSFPVHTHLSVAMTAGSDCLPLGHVWDPSINRAFPTGTGRTNIELLRRVDAVRIDVDFGAVRFRVAAHSSIDEHIGRLTVTSGNERAPKTNSVPNFLRDVPRLFRKAPIAELTISASVFVGKWLGENHWAVAFELLPNLKRLAVSVRSRNTSKFGDPLVSMLKVISNLCDDDTERCPGLHTLILGFADAKQEAVVLPCIEDCLRHRAARGCRISRLTIIRNCVSGSSDVHWAEMKRSTVERYRVQFQSYVDTVDCGDASYFSWDDAKQE